MTGFGLSRRTFIRLAGASAALTGLATAGVANADPYFADAKWIANHTDTRLLGADGLPIVGLPRWTRMRILREYPTGLIQVWVPRFDLVGSVASTAIGPVGAPTDADLQAEKLEGPTVLESIGLPGRVVGGANLRTSPGVADNLLRTLPHNGPLRVLDGVQGDDGDEWYTVNSLDSKTQEPTSLGYIHNSLVRLPRLPYTPIVPDAPDRSDTPDRHFEADLKEPALLTAFEDGAPIWSTLTLKGTISNRTPSGFHRILWRVPNETMTSERVYPPIPRDAPGGYYLQNVLFTQYFTADGASIHYNYWSSNWGYAGSHGCLGVAYDEAKFAWDWAAVGTPVYVFT